MQVGLGPGWQPELTPDQVVLARSADFRPVLLSYRSGDRQVVELAFDPAQSDLIYRPAFPSLVANTVARFRGEESLRLGQPLPDGATQGGQPVRFAHVPGVYDYPGGQLSVSLLSANETRLPGPRASTEGPAATAAAAEATATDNNVTRWLLLLLPVLFAVEWLLWSRRSAAPARA